MKKETTAEAYLEKIMTDPIQEDYPVHRTLELLSGKWRTHTIYELCKRPSMRFSELKRAYPHITTPCLRTRCEIWKRLASSTVSSSMRSRLMLSIP